MRFIICVALSVFTALYGLATGAPKGVLSVHNGHRQIHPTEVTPHAVVTTVYDEPEGLRNVSYFINTRGHVIVDGDIIYGREDDLSKAEERARAVVSGNLKSRAFSTTRRPWDGAKILFRYESNDVENTLSSTVQKAQSRWQERAPYLKFEQRPNGNDKLSGVLTIHSYTGSGCSSTVGYYVSGTMEMYLAGPFDDSVGCAVHEFGHVLGLEHEHSRPDRDKYIGVHCENIVIGCDNMPKDMNCCATSIPSGCCADKFSYRIIDGDDVDWSGPYDLDSVMHYGNKYGEGNRPILDGARSDANPYRISDLDFKRVCKIYAKQCPGGGK